MSVARYRSGDGLGGRRSCCVVVGTPRRSSRRASRRKDEVEDVDREGEGDAREEHRLGLLLSLNDITLIHPPFANFLTLRLHSFN